MNKIRLLLFFIITFPCYIKANECGSEGEGRCAVSVINLIATPDKYHDKFVVVSGYIDTKKRSHYGQFWLSFSRGVFDPSSMISLNITEKDIEVLGVVNGEYYTLVGKFFHCENSIDEKDCYDNIIPIKGSNGELSIRKRIK